MGMMRPLLIMILSASMLALGDPDFVPTNPAAADMSGVTSEEEAERQEAPEGKDIEDYRYDVPPKDDDKDRKKQREDEKE